MSETAAKKKHEVVEIPGEGTITFDYDEKQTVSASPFTLEPQAMNTVDKVVFSAFAALAVGILGAASWFGWKAEQKRIEEDEKRKETMKRKRAEREQWFDNQRKSGRVVIETRDQEYIAIPAEAYAQAEVRKKAL